MDANRWPRVSTKSPEGSGPPCIRCGSDRSERYRTGMDEIKCVNLRGCLERARNAERMKAVNGQRETNP